MSLPNAIEKTRLLHKAEGQNAASRDAAVKVMGYNTLNGASATILSALNKFGLVEAAGQGEVRVSELAMRIMFPHEGEGQDALQEAAHRPALFGELREKWPDRRPSDDNLRSYLIRKGFTQTATEQVIQFYRETLDMVGGSATAQNPAMLPALKDLPMSTASSPIAPVVSNAPPAAPPLGKPFLIGFDGAVLTGSMAIRSVKEMDRFIRILQVQRSALEAMEEDDVAADRVAEPPSEED